MSAAIELEEIPKEKDYEDYLAAYLQAGGLYVERNIIHREAEELLELDILASNFQQEDVNNLLVEIKSGGWGFEEIFKIKGWLTYLNFENGCFIVQKQRKNIDFFKEKASELNIELIDNSDLEKTKETLNHLLLIEPDEKVVESIRFSFLLERKLLKELKTLKKSSKKSDENLQSYFALDEYFFKINSGSFFTRDPIQRINRLFDHYVQFKNITAKICHELEGGNFDDDVDQLSKECFERTFYKAEEGVLQVALYVEHIARLTILKSVTSHLIDKLNGNYNTDDLESILGYLSLPQSIEKGLNTIVNDKYFHLYPRFWQFFTYVFGGFILTDLKEREYELLSEKTGIPVSEIPNAFEAFNKLFPIDGGWFYKFTKSEIEWHRFFPISFCGIGANYRRMVYSEDKTYDNLSKQVTKNMTMKDLGKWNDLAYRILKK